MRLLLTIGFYNILFGEDANFVSILPAFEKAKYVTVKGYGNDKKYTIEGEPDNGEFEFRLVQNDSITLTENDNRQLNLIVGIEEEKRKMATEKYTALNELEVAKKEIVSLKETIENLNNKLNKKEVL